MARAPEQPPSAERLVFFTDAVVAIALTLLVLPLVDLVPEARRGGLRLGQLLGDNLSAIGAFLLSFAVISRFWWAHHELFRHVSGLSRPLVRWNLLWTFSIVFLPVPTAIITSYAPSPGTVAIYIGTLVVTSGALTMLTLTVHRHAELGSSRPAETREEVLGSVAAFTALLLALVVGTVFARTVGFYPLLLLLLTDPVERLVRRHWSRTG